MADYVVVLDEDSRARLLHMVNDDLARRTPNVAAGPSFRARDALTWAITTDAAEARGELALGDWWMSKDYTGDDEPDFHDGVRHVIHGLRNVKPDSTGGSDG